jgi:Ni2+-binding GTPase involved in maturation of urease and hydrogenase
VAVTHRTSLRLHVVLPSGADRVLQADFAGTATVAQLSEALREQCGLPLGVYDVCVMGADAALNPAAGLADVQLLHGQTVYLLPTRSDSSLPLAPYLDPADQLRLVHESGPQLGYAWPFRNPDPLRLRLRPDRLLVPCVDGAYGEVLRAVLSGDRRGAVIDILSGDIELHINGWAASGKVEIRPGSLVQLCLFGAEGQMIDLRLMTGSEHEAIRNRHGLVTYRVKPPVFLPAVVDTLDLRLEAPPSLNTPPLDYMEIALQDGSMILIYVMFALRGGLGAFSILFLAVPLARVAYRFYRHQRSQDQAEAEHAAWQVRTARELGVLQTRAQQEAKAVDQRHSSLEVLAEAARTRGPALWQRRPGDEGFLTHILGRGKFQSASKAVIPGNLTEGDKEDWRKHAETMRVVENAPVEISLLDHHLGILAPHDVLYPVVRHNLLRILLSYSPAHLAVGALLPSDSEDANELSWLNWLPHVQSPTSLFIGSRIKYGSSESRRSVADSFEFLRDKSAGAEHLLLIVHEAAGVDVGLLEPFIEASEGRVHVVWIGAARSLLPAMIDIRLEVRDEDRATFYPYLQDIQVERANRSLADELGRSMAGLVDEGSSTVSSAVPQLVPLGAICSPALEAGSLDASESLVAAMGETATSLMEIDLVQQGPHLLIGGTTGSGKSELLRSMLLSLASRYTSCELAILLIDYKGGASLEQFRPLPHCIGMVSNLGEDDVRRVIHFLNAEIARRQGLLKDYQGEYRLYRREGNSALPRLVVVIDEFGGFTAPVGGGTNTSNREAAILNIAARGRSLGVHLVLSTQSPRGVVSPAVLANVNARLCLRTLDDGDSVAIIGEPDAARLPRSLVGRCFARLDTGELVQFQSAYTGSSTLAQRDDDKPVSLRDTHPARPFVNTDAGDQSDADPTDAEVLVARVLNREQTDRATEEYVPPDQPELKRRLEDYEDAEMGAPPVVQEDQDLSLLGSASDDAHETAPPSIVGNEASFGFRIGLRDAPEHQDQWPEDLDLSTGSVLVTGGSVSGRTTVLVNAVRQFRAADAAGQVVLIDAGGGDLARTAEIIMDATWVISSQFQASLAHLVEQISVDYMGDVPAPLLIALDRLDLCQEALGGNLGALARSIASGGRRNVFIVATADRRLPLEPELSKAFRYRYHLRDDQTRIMTDPEEVLIRAYLPPTAALDPAVPSTAAVRRPLGFMSDAAMDQLLATASPRGIAVGVDEIRHEPVELTAMPGIAVTGPASSGKTSCLLSLCWHVAARTNRPVALLADYDLPACDWLIDVRRRWRDGRCATPDDMVRIFTAAMAPGAPVLAIDDLDRLNILIAGLGISPDPTYAFKTQLGSFISNNRVSVLAAGAIEILGGKAQPENQMSDGLHAMHQNFIVLQPLPEEIVADRGLYGLRRRIAPLPGRAYPQGSGIAMNRTGRHEIRVRIPGDVQQVLNHLPKDTGIW